MITHVMTDIETLGTRPGMIVLSAAFVRFSDEACMSINLSIPDQEMLGLEKDDDTLAWWRDMEAKTPGTWARATSNPLPLATALPYINQWMAWATGGGDWRIWCHGATFDCPLMGEVYRRAKIDCPWGGKQFWRVRDTRSLYDLALVDPRNYSVPPPHVALNDAIGQTRAANDAMRIIARAHQPQRRFFHHPESDSLFFTDDGSHPAESGGIDAAHCNEILAGEYIKRAGMAA